MEPWRIPRQMAKGSDVANNYYYSYRVSRWLVRLQYNIPVTEKPPAFSLNSCVKQALQQNTEFNCVEGTC